MAKYRLSEIAKKTETGNDRGPGVEFESCKPPSSDLDRLFFVLSPVAMEMWESSFDVSSSHRQAKVKSVVSRAAARLARRCPAALQSTLEFLQEHTWTLRSVTLVMGGFPESVTMTGRL